MTKFIDNEWVREEVYNNYPFPANLSDTQNTPNQGYLTPELNLSQDNLHLSCVCKEFRKNNFCKIVEYSNTCTSWQGRSNDQI